MSCMQAEHCRCDCRKSEEDKQGPFFLFSYAGISMRLTA